MANNQTYTPTEWKDGDTITANLLNKLENAVQDVNENIAKLDNIVAVQNTQPTEESNRIWIPETAGTEVEVPDMEEFNDVKSHLGNIEAQYYFDENIAYFTDFENGQISFWSNPWAYVNTNNFLRTPKGKEIFLKQGYVFGLTDYTDYTYYLGSKSSSGISMLNSGWKTEDIKLYGNAYFAVMIKRNDGTAMKATDITAVRSLIKIIPYNTNAGVDLTMIGGFINANGGLEIVDNAVKSVTTQFIKVFEGEQYTLYSQVGSGEQIEIFYGFYSDQKNFISPRNSYTSTNYIDTYNNKIGFTTITVPQNANYMRVTFRSYEKSDYHVFKEKSASNLSMSSPKDVYVRSLENEKNVISLNKVRHNIRASLSLALTRYPVMFNTINNTMRIPSGTDVFANKTRYGITNDVILDISMETMQSTSLIVLYDISTHIFSVITYSQFSAITDTQYIVCSIRWYPYACDRIKIDLSCPWTLNGEMYGLPNRESIVKGIAHRGLSYTAPENTIVSFQLAKIWGFKYVETDVMFTSDNVPVLLHDPTINRTARNADGSELSSTINISDITYEQALEYDFGVWKSSLFAGEKIPKFEDFMKLCRNLSLHPFIELKTNANLTAEKIQTILSIVKKYGMEKYTAYNSFSAEYLAIVKGINPNAVLCYHTNNFSDNDVTVCVGLKTEKNSVIMSMANETDANVQKLINADIEYAGSTTDNSANIVAVNPYATWQFSNGSIASMILSGNALKNLVY